MIFAYFMLMAALVVGTRVVSVVFTSGIVRSLQVSPEPSDNDAAYHRYGTRALLGVYPIPPGYLRVLCQILRISTLIMFAGFLAYCISRSRMLAMRRYVWRASLIRATRRWLSGLVTHPRWSPCSAFILPPRWFFAGIRVKARQVRRWTNGE